MANVTHSAFADTQNHKKGDRLLFQSDMGDMELDFEDELMDLESNESAYMPAQQQLSSRQSFSGGSSGGASVRSSLSLLHALSSEEFVPDVEYMPSAQLSTLSIASTTTTIHTSASATTTTPHPQSPPHHHQQQEQQHPPPQYPPPVVSVQQILEAAAANRQAVHQQVRERFGSTTAFPPSASASSVPGSSFSAAASTFVAKLISPQELQERELDEHFLRRKAIVKEMNQQRQQQIVARVGHPIDATTVIVQEYPHVNREAVEQMIEKLDVVVETSFQEMQQQAPAAAVLWAQLLQELTPLESAYLAKAADERFEEQMKYCAAKGERETQKCIEQHLDAILISRVPQRNGHSMGKAVRHSLGQLLQDFRGIFLTCYENFVAQHQVHQIAQVLPLVAADVNQCGSILVQLLLFKYPFLATWKQFVHRCVISVLFEQLQPTLHGIYVAAFRTEDSVLEDIAQLKRANPVRDFGVRRIFRLDGSWASERGTRRDRNELRLQSLQQYSSVIYQMNALPNIRSPLAKIESVVQICRGIDATIKAYYAQQPQPQPTPEQISVYVNKVNYPCPCFVSTIIASGN